MDNDIFGKVMATSYGLECILCSPQQWEEIKNDMPDPYDVSIGDIHIRNYGFVILDAEYKQPIDNEYDLEEINKQVQGSLNETKRILNLNEAQLRKVIRKTISTYLKESLKK